VVAPPAPEPGRPDLTAFAHGSPEESYLRDHTLYLTHGRAGVPGVVWRILLGIVFNVIIVTLGLALVFVPLGWLYAIWWPALRSGCPLHCPARLPFAIPGALWIAVIGTAAAAFVSGFAWLAWRFRQEWTRTFWGWVSGILVAASLVMLLFFVGIPFLIHLARPIYGTVSAPTRAHATKTTTVVVTGVGLAGLVGTWLAAAGRLLATPKGVEGDVVKGVAGFAKKHQSLLVNVGATIAGPLMVLAGDRFDTYRELGAFSLDEAWKMWSAVSGGR